MIPWSTRIQLASIAKGLGATGIGCEGIELRGAGAPQVFRQRLLLIYEIGEAPTLLIGLLPQPITSVLRVGGEAIAGDGEHGDLVSEIRLQAGDLWLHVFHEGAMRTEQHHQQRAPWQITATHDIIQRGPGRITRHQGQ